MKTTLDLPDDLMVEIKILAAKTNRRMKDLIAESLRRDLGIGHPARGRSIRDLKPVSLGEEIALPEEDKDRMEEMLDERGHRY